MNTTKTPQQLHNLREALEVWWPSVPEANVAPRLATFTVAFHDRTNCGTVACFMGWAARWPALRQQGLGLDSFGFPTFGDNRNKDVPGSAKALFGDAHLWFPRGVHIADQRFCGTDHALVTNRLRWALEH